MELIWCFEFGYWELTVLLLIDGHNLLHSSRTLVRLNSIELQRERDRLIEKLSHYRQTKSIEIIAVFDGWQAGWSTEKKEKKKGIDLIFSRVGEKADEVIKRLIREKGSGIIVITSDREISNYANNFSVPVIPSDQFLEKLERGSFEFKREDWKGDEEEEDKGSKKKGPSRQLSKKEKRLRTALKKL